MLVGTEWISHLAEVPTSKGEGVARSRQWEQGGLGCATT